MKPIRSLICLLALLMALAIPSLATTYSRPLTASFGIANTGKTANMQYKVVDTSGSTLIASTNTGVTESPSGSGIYQVIATWDDSWAGAIVQWIDTTDSLYASATISPSIMTAVNQTTLNATNTRVALALPAVAPAAAGGLPTLGTGAGQLNPDGTGALPVSSGTGTGQISLSAGKVLLQATQTGVTIPTVTTVTSGVTVATNNDKTGYALTAGEHTNIASDTQTGMTAQGYTTTVATNIGTTNTRVALALPAVAPATAGGLPTVDLNNAVKLQSGTGANQISLSSGLVALTAGEHTSIATDAGTGVLSNSANKLVTNASGQVVASSVVGAVGSVTGAVGSVTANVGVGTYASGQDPATLVLGATASTWNTAATIGNKINSAASAGNPWSTDISTGYTGTQAGNLLYAIRSGQPVTLPTTAPSGYGGASAATVAAAILSNPSNLLSTNASGQVVSASVANAPTNWPASVIDLSGRYLLQPSQPGVTIPTVTAVTSANVASYSAGQDPGTLVLANPANKLTTNSFGYVTATNGGTGGDPFATSTTSGSYTSGTWGYFLTHAPSATVAGYSSGQDPASLVWASLIDGTLTAQDVLTLDAANLAGAWSNSWNNTTHTLTTTYKRQDGATTALTNATVYASGSSAPSAQSRAGTNGTLP